MDKLIYTVTNLGALAPDQYEIIFNSDRYRVLRVALAQMKIGETLRINVNGATDHDILRLRSAIDGWGRRAKLRDKGLKTRCARVADDRFETGYYVTMAQA